MSVQRATAIVVLILGMLCHPAIVSAQGSDEQTTWNSGFFWGQFFGGMTEDAGKATYQAARLNASWNLWDWNLFPPKAYESPTRAIQDSAATRTGTILVQAVAGAQFSRHSFGNNLGGFTTSSYFGGLRFLPSPKKGFRLYFQGLAGLQRSFDANALAIAPEAGVIIPVNNLWLTINGGIEVAFYEGGSDTGTRLLGGLTVPFGRR